nr:sulf3b [Psylliodes attenuatus]
MHLDLKVLFLICVQILAISTLSAKTSQPNIVIIIADDVGWNDFGLHGSNQIPTPNIDALGYNGVILDKFYTQQTCTPSRASLLTGKYPIRLGLQGAPIETGENRALPFDTPLMSELLKDLGYSTHLVGKWHLGAACNEHTPTMRGFDTHFGFLNGYTGYFRYTISVPDPRDKTKNMTGFDLRDAFEPQWALKGQYATELFNKKSLEVIEKHDTSNPLFLVVSHLAGHSGENGTELGVPDQSRTDELYSYIASPERRQYADLINLMDQSVGDVVAKLSERGMLENSIILFFSDNGAPTVGKFNNFGSGWPFRGLKFTLFEGGVRGTGIIYSPLFEQKNYVNRELIHISDILPTLYRAAGGNLDTLGTIDGVDQWDTISTNIAGTRSEMLINIDEKKGYSGIFDGEGRFKLLNGTYVSGNSFYGEDGRGSENPSYDYDAVINSSVNIAIQSLGDSVCLEESIIEDLRTTITLDDCKTSDQATAIKCDGMCLFDIWNDPCEVENLINETTLADVVDELKAKLDTFVAELVPQTNKARDPKCDPVNFNGTWSPWLTCDVNAADCHKM